MMENEESDAFEWLADLSKRQCFTTCELSHPAKSLDFGSEGFTASLTDWHELLQLTRPDATCGVVFLRGSFPDNPGSILSRAQRRDDTGSKGTLGTRLLPPDPRFPDDVELGERKAQGWVNFRWPYSQYELVRRDPRTGEIMGTGSCEAISFVHRGTFFQINRLKWGHGSSVSEYDASGAGQGNNAATARFRIGGNVRFGCPCSNSGSKAPEDDSFTVTNNRRTGLCCTSTKYQTRLEIGFTENGVARQLTPVETSDGSSGQPWINLSSEIRINIPVGEANFLVSTYALRNDEEDDDKDCSVELPADLTDYLGVSRESVNMTDRLWTALCAANYEAVDAVEFCIIGRCVEQILGVTSVPVRQPPGGARPLERALIGNIITSQFVDVQSAFFQIRLLTKIYNFIETRKLEPDLLQQYRTLDEIRDAYLVRLRHVIRSTITWLYTTDLKPGRLLLAVHSQPATVDAQGEPINPRTTTRLQSCAVKRLKLTWDTSYNRGCYVTMANWYALKLCPEALDTPNDHTFIQQVVLPELPVTYRLGMERSNRDKQPTSKGNVLGWLHFSAILILHDELGWDENELPEGVSRRDLQLETIKETQQRFEKYVTRLKTSHADGWSMEHEELDRVLLLAEEMANNLGFDKYESLKRSRGLAISRAKQTRRRIHERRRTTKFNTGPKPWMAARSLSNGPWELLCTNHESYLRVADDSHAIPARDRLFEFLLSDYSFMASWDRADAAMVGRWWDIQPVAMICSTLLDLKLEGKLQGAAAKDPPPKDDKSREEKLSQSIPNLRAVGTVNFDAAEFLNTQVTGGNDAAAQMAMMGVLVQQLRRSIEDSGKAQAYEIRQLLASSLASAGGDGMMGLSAGKPFEWVFQKPAANYYPDWWVQSLEDTPDIFHYTTTPQRDVGLRTALKHYLQAQGAPNMMRNLENTGGYTLANVTDHIKEEDVQLLDVFDILQDGGFSFYVKRRRCIEHPELLPAPTGLIVTTELGPRPTSIGAHSGTLVTTPLPTTPIPTPGRDGFPEEEREEVPDSSTYEDVLRTLNDSLVDVGAKHRIIFVQKFSPALVGGIIHMWHPDALDTIDDHFGATSRFTESREMSLWTTSITISHWTMRTKRDHRADKHHELHRQNGDFPPENIANLSTSAPTPTEAKVEPEPEEEHIVEEQSTSIVFTGDPAGYMWICSVMSPVTDSKSIGKVIANHKGGIPSILKKFIHQQGSGRCLVFLLLLGHVCEKLAGEYTLLLKRLDDIMDIGDRTLLEGLEDWFTNESINKLKKMLWGWEALRVFNDKLSSSLSQIQRAQEAMEHIIKLDAAQQDVDLIQQYNSIVDEFKKRYGMLSDVHNKTQLKIKQVTGLRDGISTITNVVDTQTALADNKTTIQQGNNVRTLTYITIGYLPLGFVCALYSLNEGDFMEGASNALFAGLIVGFSLGTYLLAYVMDRALLKIEGRVLIPAFLRRGKGKGGVRWGFRGGRAIGDVGKRDVEVGSGSGSATLSEGWLSAGGGGGRGVM